MYVCSMYVCTYACMWYLNFILHSFIHIHTHTYVNKLSDSPILIYNGSITVGKQPRHFTIQSQYAYIGNQQSHNVMQITLRHNSGLEVVHVYEFPESTGMFVSMYVCMYVCMCVYMTRVHMYAYVRMHRCSIRSWQ